MPRHSEKRVVSYTDEQMFALVADVERYAEFVPWVAAIRIKSRDGDTFVCDVLAAFGALRQHFTSRVTLDRAAMIITAEYVDGPFHHLNNRWQFIRRDDGCEVDFDVDFTFNSKALDALIGTFFTRAVHKMTEAFEERARKLYGENAASKHPA